MQIIDALIELFNQSNFVNLPWQNWIMIGVSFVLLYLAIVKKFEPLLLIPIAFGMLLVNIYPEIMADPTNMSFIGDNNPYADPNAHWYDSGVLRLIYAGVKSSIFPCLIFMGVGAMTDFGPLLANPSSLLLGAAAQLGIYVAFTVAMLSGEFTPQEAASIAIIGGADGPTAIFLTGKLAPHMLGSIAVAAYSYMALIPLIQPPIMKLLTTKKEREIKMNQLRTVSKAEKIIFPIIVTVICVLLIPDVAPLLGFLMLGNLFKESGVTDRLSDTAQNTLCNIITILLGVTVGATAEGKTFLDIKTLLIIGIGLLAFAFSTAGGVLFAKFLNLFLKEKINPMIGAAGISAFPMSGRVVHKMGLEEDPQNFLLMQSIGVNVSGQIASVIAGGLILSFAAGFGGFLG